MSIVPVGFTLPASLVGLQGNKVATARTGRIARKRAVLERLCQNPVISTSSIITGLDLQQD
ncbi:hypothetical protein GCM10011402_17530 [Paracoccus acridae]|uniref:Uncharacterized protein n=1 Tax=Paracoccus acridae TaxID=1795310 RepID=A0ABQ1VIS3_9RHOB|nr:hypothetical protein GCM10011402_17530 [Paracoccus acridae]